jgi:hypothetical protein
VVAGCGASRVELACKALRQREMSSRGGSYVALDSTLLRLGRRVDDASFL